MINKIILIFLIIIYLSSNALAEKDKLIISVASSLYKVSKELANEWEKNEKTKIIIIPGSTPLLARQIERGQRSEFIITANYYWLEWMLEKGLVEKDSILKIAKNSLVIISGINKPIYLDINSPKFKYDFIEQISSSMIAIPHPSSVPLGIYSKQALKSLDLWDSIEKKLVYTSSAQANLKFISQGEVNLGISYLSDAIFSSKVKILSQIDNKKFEYEQPIYWAAKVKNKNNDNYFLEWLIGDKAQNIFKNYGFEIISKKENN